MKKKTIEILLLEDSASDADLLRRMLQGNATFTANIEWVQSLSAACDSIANKQYDVVLADLGLPDSYGLETIDELKQVSHQIPIIALTGGDSDLALKAIRAGADDYICKDQTTKPIISRAVSYTIERFHITQELEKANSSLLRKNERLAKMYEMSQQFVDNVSHEFRTPLTVIREFAAIVKDGIDGPVNAKQENRLATLISRTDDLALMVDDLLDTSRLESGLLKTCRQENNLLEIVSQVEKMLRPKALAKKIQLNVKDISSELKVFCDEEKLRRILINLVVNAIKFTPVQGQVEISAEIADSNRVKITVSDDGDGMSEEDLSRIFERFKQVGAHERMASCKGFGLGLSIARALASLNLGSLEVNSEEGVGSQFSVLVPHAKIDAVLNCFFDQRETTQDVNPEISIVEVEPECFDENDSDEILETVDDFLRSSVKTFDLVVNTDKDRWLVYACVGSTSLPKVLNRISDEWSKLKRNYYGTDLPELKFQTLDTIDVAGGREKLLSIGQLQEANVNPPAAKETLVLSNRRRVLIVDDELEVTSAIESRLQASGFEVTQPLTMDLLA